MKKVVVVAVAVVLGTLGAVAYAQVVPNEPNAVLMFQAKQGEVWTCVTLANGVDLHCQ